MKLVSTLPRAYRDEESARASVALSSAVAAAAAAMWRGRRWVAQREEIISTCARYTHVRFYYSLEYLRALGSSSVTSCLPPLLRSLTSFFFSLTPREEIAMRGSPHLGVILSNYPSSFSASTHPTRCKLSHALMFRCEREKERAREK